jgi:hypothetical protein
MADIPLPLELQRLIDENPEPAASHHLVPQTADELKELGREQGTDYVRDKLIDHGLKKPAFGAARQLGQMLTESGTELINAGRKGETLAAAGRFIGTGAEFIESADTLIATAETGVGIAAAVGYVEWKGLRYIDDHTGNALSNSAVARARDHLLDVTGISERLDYASQALDAYETAHPLASRQESGKAWASALKDPHMLDNHAASLQAFVNKTVTDAGYPHYTITPAEAKVLVPILQAAQKGDALVMSGPHIYHEAGPNRPALQPGEISLDASTLLAAAMTYQKNEPEKVSNQPVGVSRTPGHDSFIPASQAMER